MAKAFLPYMVASNHGMFVTVSSIAAFGSVPTMVDYSSSKVAALAFHEGLALELATKYKAPKVRTVIVHPGHTKTDLFTGADMKKDFMFPLLEADTIAQAVVQQVLSGRSGQIILPEMGGSLPSLRGMQHWYFVRSLTKQKAFMDKWRGRQVIADVNASYDDDKSSQHETSESTVLVPGAE